MKGVIFTELLDFVEEQFSPALAAQVLSAAQIPVARYQPFGNYDHHELGRLIDGLSAASHVPAAELTRRFGAHVFQRFASLYPAFLDGAESALDLLAGIETTIHGELLKLYPDAEFPSFACTVTSPKHLELIYRSRRHLADFAEGLILGCVAHFGDPVEVRREDLPAVDVQAVRFTLGYADA